MAARPVRMSVSIPRVSILRGETAYPVHVVSANRLDGEAECA